MALPERGLKLNNCHALVIKLDAAYVCMHAENSIHGHSLNVLAIWLQLDSQLCSYMTANYRISMKRVDTRAITSYIAIYTVAVRWLYSLNYIASSYSYISYIVQLHSLYIYHYIRNQLTYTHAHILQLQSYIYSLIQLHTINIDQLYRCGTDVILPCAAALTKPKTARVPAIKMKQLRRLKTAEPLFCMSRTIDTKIINTAVCQHISLKLHRVSIA